MSAIAQPSMTTGEFSPSLSARVDLSRYYTALKTCRNWIVRPYGGVVKRPGTMLCAEVKNHAKKVRLIDFQFSSAQTYVLEFGDQYIRVHWQGAPVVYPVGHLQVGQPVEVSTLWSESELFLLKVVQSADVMTICHPGYQPKQLSRLDHHVWTLTGFVPVEGPFQDINVDTAKTIIASAPSGDPVTLTANWDFFTADHRDRLLYLEQPPDDNTRRWEVQKTISLYDVRRAGVHFYQAQTAGETGTVRPSITEGSESDGDPGVTWKYVHSGFGIVKITSIVNARTALATVVKQLPDQITQAGAIKNVANVVSGTPVGVGEPPSPAVSAKVQVNGHGFPGESTVIIAGVTGAAEANGTWTIQPIDANWFYLVGLITTSPYTGGGTAKLTTAAVPTYKWAFSAWGGEQGYPATAMYYQQRQIFGGSTNRPHAVWMSRTGGFKDFGKSNPILDDDALTFSLNSRKMNEIRHFVGLRELVALTSEGSWVIKKEQGNPIPGTDFQGKGGSSHVPPVMVGKRALFILEKGRAVRSLGYFYESDSYEGQDLTMTASHLLSKGLSIVDWAYQETPFSCVWMVRSDGALLGLTYMPDQEVIGWHRHDTDGVVESVACVPEGDEDAVYVAVRRIINGQTKRYIERFASRYVEDQREAFFVDSGLTYDGRNASATTVTLSLAAGTTWDHTCDIFITASSVSWTDNAGVVHNPTFDAGCIGDAIVFTDADGAVYRLTIFKYMNGLLVVARANRTIPAEYRNVARADWSFARDSFAGLGHLEGKGVAILADGKVVSKGESIVQGGTVALGTPAAVVHVGLPIVADLETLNVNAQGESIQDRVKNIRSVTLLVEETKGLAAGPDADHLLDSPAVPTGSYDDPDEDVTGNLAVNIVSDWSTGGRVFIRHDEPLPATVLAIIPEVSVGGA